jgi:hypothetical protein
LLYIAAYFSVNTAIGGYIMKHPVFLVLLFFTSLNVFGQSSEDERRIIFPAQQKLQLLPKIYSSAARFTPTLNDIDRVDKYLARYFNKNLPQQKYAFDNYFRQ